MNWVFLDFSGWDYDIATPLSRPLGGSHSALCYLATELARVGHPVTVANGLKDARIVNGVQCVPLDNLTTDVFVPTDTIVIVLNGPGDIARQLQPLPVRRPLILWTQHAHDQPAMASLRDPVNVSMWDHIVCISDWQKGMFQREFSIPADKIQVLRNAISPVFQNLFCDAAHLAETKSRSLRLAYTSTPFRGLEFLATCFPPIFHRHPHCQLDVFSSMQVYGQPATEDPYQSLYDQLRSMPGVVYRGSVSQTELAHELAQISVLAYPNTFPETSCIAVMEALAAGLLVVTSDLGALPETCAGFAHLVPPVGPNRGLEPFVIDFARTLDQTLFELKTNRPAVMQRLFDQSQEINRTCTWSIRAQEWVQLAQTWL
ncbi:MAG TPA: glycosyltransferase family 4 protein [Pirellulaceae bacterium]|jgi:glycosyltransferase involved in cell wall biosynthesis